MGEIAVEIKGTNRIDKKDMNGIEAFTRACPPKRSIIVCNKKERRIHAKIEIAPWEDFLQQLWAGKIL